MNQPAYAKELTRWFKESMQSNATDAWSGTDEELGHLLVGFLGRAKARWSAFDVSEQEFMGYLASRIGEMSLAEALSSKIKEDIWLAFAALKHDSKALFAFDKLLKNAMNFKENRQDLSAAGRNDFLQHLRESLLVAAGSDGIPKLSQYSGKGALKGWIRVVLMREKIQLLKVKKKEEELSNAVENEFITEGGHPEIVVLRKEHLVLFRNALQRATKHLESEDKLLLRYWLINRMTLEQIGDVCGNHRLTVGRKLNKLKRRLLSSVKSYLSQHHRLKRSEIKSLVHNFESKFDASLHSVLAGSQASSVA